jgi:Arc/MetJ family transcription regulator
VCNWCKGRTNIDIDDEACQAVMHRFGLTSKRDAVNFALRSLAVEPLSLDKALAMEGSGWEGDLEEMRAGRP